MPLILLALFIIGFIFEVRLISWVYQAIAQRFDGLSAVFLILLSFFVGVTLGLRLIRYQSQLLMKKMQSGTFVPKDSTRSFLTFAAGVLFLIPGYVSDILALAFLFPPTAWLINIAIGTLLQKLMTRVKFSSFGGGGFGSTYSASYGGGGMPRNEGPFASRNDPNIIDVEVVDSKRSLLSREEDEKY